MPSLLDSTAIFDYTVGYKGGVFNMQYLNTNTPTVNSTLFMMQVFLTWILIIVVLKLNLWGEFS